MIYFVGHTIMDYEGIQHASLEECLEYLRTQSIIGIDIETSRKFQKGLYNEKIYKPGLDPRVSRIIMIIIGTLDRQYIIDTRTIDASPLCEIFTNDALKIGHFLKFEQGHFKHNYDCFLNNIWDTYIAEKVLYNGLEIGFSLEDLMGRYLGIESVKNMDLFNQPKLKTEDWLSRDNQFLLGVESEQSYVDKSTRLEFVNWGDKPFTLKQLNYGAEDIISPLKVYEIQKQGRMVDGKLYLPKIGFQLENKFTTVLARMEYNGMPFNQIKWLETYEKNKKIFISRKELIENWITNNTPYHNAIDLFTSEKSCALELSSSKQMITLFKYLDSCPKEKSKHTGRLEYTVGAVAMFKLLTNENKIKFYSDSFPKEIVDVQSLILAYLLYKKSEQLTTTFGKDFLKYVHPISYRIHTNFNQYMISSRLSSNNPNCQNIPSTSDFRHCFSDGSVIFNADFSSQESYILADVSGVKLLQDFFNKGHEIFGRDLHSLAATMMKRKLTGDETVIVTKKSDPEMRNNAKALNFSLSYGASEYSIAAKLGISEEEAIEMINAYFEGFKGLKEDFEKRQKLALNRGWIELDSYTGKRYFYPHFKRMKELITEAYSLTEYNQGEKIPEKEKERLREETNWTKLWREYMSYKGELQRKGLNLPIQGAAASQTKLAGILFYRDCKPGDELLLMVHDEILATTSNHDHERVRALLQHSMEKGAAYITKSVKLRAEALIDTFWQH